MKSRWPRDDRMILTGPLEKRWLPFWFFGKGVFGQKPNFSFATPLTASNGRVPTRSVDALVMSMGMEGASKN